MTVSLGNNLINFECSSNLSKLIFEFLDIYIIFIYIT